MDEQTTNARERIMAWLGAPGFRPLSKSELARHLAVPPKERAALRHALAELEAEGVVERRRGGRYGPTGGKPDIARGTYLADRRGRGRVVIEQGGKAVPPDEQGRRVVEVPRYGGGTAIHGDRVEVRVSRRERPPHGPRRGRAWSAEGEIVWTGWVTGVVEEGARRAVGIFHADDGAVVVDDRRFPAELELDAPRSALPADGDLVAIRITSWTHPRHRPLAELVENLGDPSAPGTDVLGIIHRHGLRMRFPREVEEEAGAVPDTVTEADLEGREDWRARGVVTIDPEDARDFDDGIHVAAVEGGGWDLAVHVADVAHYVKPGSAIDREARLRGNSVYLVDRVLPMLPEGLSNGICSLVPGEDRLTRVVKMRLDAKGAIRRVGFAAAVIRSARRYTYEEAMGVLDAASRGEEATGTGAMVVEAGRLAEVLRRRRFRNGALDLDFPEVKVVLDERGRPVELRPVVHDRSHQLIEECMLAANTAVAEALAAASMPTIYRIHEEPDAEKLWEFRELARLHGWTEGDASDRDWLQSMLKGIRGRAEEHVLKLALLKSLKRAAYSARLQGHHGLALERYLHFTSPIRRYADLVVHRVLGGHPEHAPAMPSKTPRQAEMEEMADHLSGAERVAADAESDSRQLKILDYFEGLLLAGGREVVFEAVAFEARRRGVLVELIDSQVRGLVPPALLSPGDWWFDGALSRWSCDRPRRRIQPGSRLKVAIARIDRDKGFLDFRVVEEGEGEPDRGWGMGDLRFEI